MKSNLGLRACALLAFAWSAPSHAILINLGDITHDTATGLEWLDVNLTAGLTYNEVLAGAGDFTSSGWR